MEILRFSHFRRARKINLPNFKTLQNGQKSWFRQKTFFAFVLCISKIYFSLHDINFCFFSFFFGIERFFLELKKSINLEGIDFQHFLKELWETQV